MKDTNVAIQGIKIIVKFIKLIVMDFNSIMQGKSDEMLVEIIKLRNDYQPEAVKAAIDEAINRGLLKENEDIDIVFPIISIEQKEIIANHDQLTDFNKHLGLFYINGILSFLLGLALIKYGIPIIPLIYLWLVYSCSKKYNHTYATIISWLTAAFFVTWTIVIIGLIIGLISGLVS